MARKQLSSPSQELTTAGTTLGTFDYIAPEQAKQMMVKTNRHKRLITSEEVAAMAGLLVGPNSGSLNGQTYEIAGGQM